MTETIVVAAISLVGTLGGSLAGVLAANKLTTYRIEQLEKKVQAHNNLIDRMYRVEAKEEVLEEEIEHLKEYHK
jgi:hypothetical protein